MLRDLFIYDNSKSRVENEPISHSCRLSNLALDESEVGVEASL